MIKNKILTTLLLGTVIVVLVSCTSTKNTSMTRWYHSFNTRYNVYFNGNEAYKTALKSQQDSYQESYSDFILMYPVSSLPKDKQQIGGPFDKSIEKAAKAIKTHSIQTKPEKKQGKKHDPKYQEFMQREEYNPFLYNAWLLMGKSQFHNGDFLTAASTFSYTARHYSTQPEIVATAKIWQARCYSEMGWYYEAEDIFSKLNNENLPKNEVNWFSSVYADYLIKNKRYSDAVPYLNLAIKAEKNKTQRYRMEYLLGQIYKDLGQNDLAYKAFGEVANSTAPYLLQFSSKIRQTEVSTGGNTKKVIGMLKKMSKSQKNKDYLDQVYYAWGNVYMTIPDTVKAIEQYKLGVEKSIQNGFDKALCQIQLGDIYFQQREYVDAQPCYSEALGQIKKEYKDYQRISKRSEILDELVVHFEAIELQDSLQILARLPEAERMASVKKLAENYIKKEEEAKKESEKEEYLTQQESNREQMENFNVGRKAPSMATPAITPARGGNAFYFYNPQTVTQGKNEFQRKWGKRKLEDNWRLRNKINQFDSELAETQPDMQPSTDSEVVQDTSSVQGTEKSAEELEAANNPRKPEYYLQQIPLTEEDIAASNDIWMDGLYNMGLIYKDKLEDSSLAIETFTGLNNRFPDNEFKLDVYYQLYLIYLKMNDMNMVELYKSKIREEFPESDYAIAMADPNYEYNMRMIDVVQDSIYQQTYQYYTENNPSGIRKNYDEVAKKYPQSKLMPKFMFLDALSYVQTHEPDIFKQKLKELLDKYPDADVSVLAGSMMKNLLKGLTLSGDGNLAKGGLFNIRFGATEEGAVLDSTIVFTAEKNTPYLLLMVYPANHVDGNIILYTVAEFNFSNFMVNDFDLQVATIGETGMLQIRGFNNYNEIVQYCNMINKPAGYMNQLNAAVIVVPMSVDNYDILMKGKSLDEYTAFFEKNFGAENPQIIAKWKLDKKEIEKISTEDEEDERNEENVENQPSKDDVILPAKTDSLKTDSIQMIFPDTVISIETDTIALPKPVINEDEVMEKTGKAAETVSKSVDAANKIMEDISNDPIRAIQNLFSKRKKSNAIDEYVKQQEKEEKERQKQLDAEQKAKDKAAAELAKQQEKERKALLKKQQDEEKALLKEKEKQERNLEEQKKLEEKQKEAERKQLEKDKENARKQKQKDAEERQKQKEEERKAKEKARKEAQKLKEKQREVERKQKEEERKKK